jgi:release factor glutamine methyltransferase
VANPPYIPSAQVDALDRSVREYEPISALDGGLDGLVIHRRILSEGLERVVPGGRVFLEIGFDQAAAAREMAEGAAGWEAVKILKDHGGRDRVVTVRRSPP